jgi:cell wall-associated NlpC family hydrolase
MFIRREFAPVGLRKGCLKRGFFLASQLDHRLILAGKLKEHTSKRVLHLRGQGAGGFNGLFQKLCHGGLIAFPPKAWKVFRVSLKRLSSQDKPISIRPATGYEKGMTKLDPRLTPARPDLAAAHLRGLVTADAYVAGRPMQIAIGVADVHRSPSHDAPLDTQALFGEAVTLYEDHEGWGWAQLARDGYVGYVAMAALAEGHLAPTHRVAVNRTFVYPGPDLKLPARRASPLGAAVCVRATQGGFAQIGETAFVFAGHLVPYDSREKDFVAVAERFLHVPYLWGGKTSLGIDCSGLVQIALDAAGVAVPRDTDLQEKAIGAPLNLDADLTGLRRGDVIFWRGHVGIMQDAANLLHANAHHMLVASEPLRAARDRILAKTAQPITAIKRLG